ncbi:MAG: cobalamin B12-binding domain-containing protein [Clostridiales bacterium]|jgi:hypothetical protein|nr:cobalamin B12-binding domain-containing protein [Clostridiales bacterium]
MNKKVVMGASIGNCVHVAGVAHFISIAEREGYEPVFLGPAVAVDVLFDNIRKYRPDIIGISYRLTPANVTSLLDEIFQKAKGLDYQPVWLFGGTKPVAAIAKKYRDFAFISDGFDDINDLLRFLRGDLQKNEMENYGNNLRERAAMTYPYPLIRHHYGVPTMEATEKGIKKIAKAKVIDVVSLGPDQNAQQFFFNQANMQKQFDGAGGVPIRTAEDLIRLKKASACGNFPLMRCYSGTEDVFQYADMLVDTIDNAWAVVPLFWYNELDGRGTRPVEVSIKEAQQLISWHGQRNIPVEINEPHHWSLRDAHDVMSVVTAFISAYNAKKLGVADYIAQYMFNIPSGLSFSMDFARVLAMIELVETLEDSGFTIYRETRTGLPLFSADLSMAKGQLAASTFMQMAVKPHIVHVVGYCEADHEAGAGEVIESCKIARGIIKHTVTDSFSPEKDERILERKNELINEAKYVLDFIQNKFSSYHDPLTDTDVLAECVKGGYLDAVHILKSDKFRGNLATKLVEGKCLAYDKETGKIISEAQRLEKLVELNGG